MPNAIRSGIDGRCAHHHPARPARRAVILLAMLLVLSGMSASRLRAQTSSGGPGFTVGILPFQDVSGNADLGQLYTVLPNMLQSVLLDKTQLVPRQLTSAAPGQAVDLATAASLGQQAGTDVAVIGTLLSGVVKTSQGGYSGPSIGPFHVQASSNKINVTVLLQVDLVDASRGVKIATLRAKGNYSKTHFDPNVDSNYGSMNMQGAGFQNTALAKATSRALDGLAEQMVQALSHFTPAQPAPPAAAPAPNQPTAPAQPGAGTGTAAAGAQPDLKAVKIDFVPGEKTLFYDDFSDMATDEPPPHWKVRGDSVTLLIGGNTRELSLLHSQITSPRFALPASFTFQTVETFPNNGGYPATNWYFETAKGQTALVMYASRYQDSHRLHITLNGGRGNTLSDLTVHNLDFSQPVHVDLWVQNGRLRVYADGNRVVDVNQVQIPPVDQISLHTQPGANSTKVGLRKVRVAESAPDFATTILATGKYVTHGIHFDTNSAVLKPDSAPIIRQVADALETDPNLKLEIDGYTDSIGSAKRNLALSQERAEAVLSVLVSQFGIDASRLAAAGFGPASPLGSNDTAAGRAENRRVEFIKK